MMNSERQGEEICSYIRQLNTWLREDLDGHLKQRLDFSTKAIVKLVRVFDKWARKKSPSQPFDTFVSRLSLSDKYQRLFSSMNSSSSTSESTPVAGKYSPSSVYEKYIRLGNLGIKGEVYQSVMDRNTDLERENDRIQRLNTTLQSRIHQITLRVGHQEVRIRCCTLALLLPFSVFWFQQSTSASGRATHWDQNSTIRCRIRFGEIS